LERAIAVHNLPGDFREEAIFHDRPLGVIDDVTHGDFQRSAISGEGHDGLETRTFNPVVVRDLLPAAFCLGREDAT
jgi:hypothetical protein